MRRPTIVLLVLVSAAAAAMPASAAAPPNDDFAGAQALTGDSGAVAGSTVDATDEAGEPAHWGVGGGHSAWYRWIAGSAGPVTFDTCTAAFDTVLAVYAGATLDALTRIDASDDACLAGSRVTFDAAAGTEYRIAIDGYRAAVGSFSLAWRRGPAPPAVVEWPVVSGTRVDGSTLTVSSGRWSGAEPIALSYRWRRCYGACVDVVGATGQSFRLTPADVGFSIVAEVTATNAGGPTAAQAWTGPIGAAQPQTESAPLVDGAPRAGRGLFVVSRAWTGTPPITLAYQWQACAATDEGLVNAALRHPAHAARSFGANPPSMAVDGDAASWWGAGDFGRQWIEVDLGAPTPVAALRLLTSQTPAGLTAHRVYGRLAGGHEYLLHEFAGTTVDGEALQSAIPGDLQAQFVRVETILSPSWVSWREVEVLTRCRDVAGAVGSVFVPRIRDIGSTIRVVVRASNATGTIAVASSQSPRVRGCIVPRLTGATVAAARATLRRHGCRLGRITYASSARPAGRVVVQSRKATSRRLFGARVGIVVSRGRA